MAFTYFTQKDIFWDCVTATWISSQCNFLAYACPA